MEKYICVESNGLWYELQGDYYLSQIDTSASEIFDSFINQMAAQQGIAAIYELCSWE